MTRDKVDALFTPHGGATPPYDARVKRAAVRFLGVFLTACLWLPSHALAAPSEDDASVEARRLFDEGSARYETADFAGAVEFFTRAYKRAREIEDDVERQSVVNALLFNLARAHKRAYAVDGELTHLRQAEELLRMYTEPEDKQNEEDAVAMLAEIRNELARIDSEGDQPASAPDSEPAPQPEPAPAPAPAQSDKKMNGIMIAGIGLAAGSLIGGGLAIAGAIRANAAEEEFQDGPTRDDRLAARQKGESSNTMVIAGAAIGGALLVTGAVLIGVGAAKKKKQSSASIYPILGPQNAGLGLSARF
jgi:hypothetical protein